MAKNSTLVLTTSMFAFLVSGESFAQTDSDGFNDEIIVTATKREQTLQEVPVAVTVVQSEDIEKANIQDLIDLQSVTPSLRVEQIQRTTETAFFIRGFGNGSGNIGLEPSVGVFIDGVYRSRSAAQLSDLPNLERVEVLRGPQSALFGKNASAGIVSVVTSKPSFQKNGYVEAGLSNYDGRRLKAYLTGPLSDHLAFSLGGSYNKRDGYIENINLDSDIGDRNRYAVRGQLLLSPSSDLEVRAIADYDKIDEICCGFLNAVNGPTGAVVSLLGGEVITDPFGYQTSLSTDPINDVENSGISLHVDADIFKNVNLQSITAYRNLDSFASGDVDFTNTDLLRPQEIELDIDFFSQEVRLASDNEGALNWLAGIYYSKDDLSQNELITYGTDTAAFIDTAFLGNSGLLGTLEFLSGNTPGTFYEAGTGHSTLATQDAETISVFGQLDFDITDRLTLTGGLSYVKDKKSVSIAQDNTDVFSTINLFTVNGGAIPNAFFAQGFAGAITGTPLEAVCGTIPTPAALNCVEGFAPGTTAAIQAGVNDSIQGLTGLQFTPEFLGFPNAVEDGRTNDDNVDYTIKLAYDFSDNIGIYGSYATGYKASSFNLSTGSRPNAADFAQLFPSPTPGSQGALLGSGSRFALPEESEVFEVGIKSEFENFSLYLTVFEQSIKNFQSTVFLGTSFGFSNAEKQSARGVEFNSRWEPMDGFVLTAAGTYLDAEFDVFTGSPDGGDISGTRPGNVSEFSGSFGASYNWTMGDNDAFVRADYQYESDVDTENGGDLNPTNVLLNQGITRQRGVNTVNASAGVSFGDFDLSVWARNLFNDEYVLQNAPTPLQAGSVNAYPNVPRTYGLNLRYNFD